MNKNPKIDGTIFIIGIIPFLGWLILVASTLIELPMDLLFLFISFAILYALIVLATAWKNKKSVYFSFVLSLFAIVPLYFESQSSSGIYTTKLIPFLAISFVLFYSILNYIKLKRLKNEK